MAKSKISKYAWLELNICSSSSSMHIYFKGSLIYSSKTFIYYFYISILLSMSSFYAISCSTLYSYFIILFLLLYYSFFDSESISDSLIFSLLIFFSVLFRLYLLFWGLLRFLYSSLAFLENFRVSSKVSVSNSFIAEHISWLLIFY